MTSKEDVYDMADANFDTAKNTVIAAGIEYEANDKIRKAQLAISILQKTVGLLDSVQHEPRHEETP